MFHSFICFKLIDFKKDFSVFDNAAKIIGRMYLTQYESNCVVFWRR